MVIKEIHIYGYGKFENFRITNLDSLQVIYGKNEAGKSTIMSFIHSILFGFPTRQQNELRYEPKGHSKYGGQLILSDAEFGEVIIERVKGKASGDVTVILEDGTRGGEELLQRILRGMDKATYQAIYSFNIHSIQNVHKLKGEDVSRYLFSASAVGSERLMETENLLVKEQERLFRPHGKNPELNRSLNQLQETAKKLTAAKQAINRYEDLLEQLEKTEKTLQQMREKVQDIDRSIIEKKEWNRAYPLVVEKIELEKQLEKIGNPPFPHEGMRKLEQLESELLATKNRLSPRLDEARRLKNQIEATQIQTELLENQDAITLLIDSLPYYQQEMEQLKQLSLQIDTIQQELHRLFARLGLQITAEQIETLNLGLAVKDEIIRLEKEREHLLRAKQELDKRDQDLRFRLKQSETALANLQEKRLSEQERNELEEAAESGRTIEKLELERQWLETQWDGFQKKTEKKRNSWVPYLVLVSSLFISGLLIIWTENWDFLLPVIALFTILFIFFWLGARRNADDDVQHLAESLEKKRRELDEELNRLQVMKERVREAKEKLAYDNSILKELETEKIRYQQLDAQFSELITAFEKWEENYRQVEQQIIALGRSLALPEEFARRHLLDGYELLVQIKDQLFERKQLEKQRKQLEKSVAKKEQALADLGVAPPNSGVSFPEQVLSLKKILADELDKQRTLESIRSKYEEILGEIASLQEEKRIALAKMERLYAEAAVATKDEFIQQWGKVEKRRTVMDRLTLIEEQLANLKLTIPQDSLPEPVDESIFGELEKEKVRLQDEIEHLERLRASLRHDIAQIEEGGTYTELLHQFYQEKYLFNQLAREWAVYRVAASILQKSTETYKLERLPKLLKRASEIFQTVTRSEYEWMAIDQEKDEFYVKRRDGMIFSPQELSQATQEQLYISIRLALTLEMNERVAMPIIIDDGFVNFDEERLKQMVQIMKRKNQQILLFTCHLRIAELFPEEHILFLANAQKVGHDK